MTNAKQAKAKPTGQILPMGVVVDFSSSRDCPSESPSAHIVNTSSSFLEDEQIHHGLAAFSDNVRQRDQRDLSGGDIDTEKLAIAGPIQFNNNLAENAGACLRNAPASLDEQPKPSKPAGEVPVPEKFGSVDPKRNWLARWLFPDRSDKRSVNRMPTAGLVAHFWTGGPPKGQPVRDISASGVFVVTEERWYLGTQILITLTKVSENGSQDGNSITVLATAVRWGEDGVGLEFVNKTVKTKRNQQPLHSDGASGEQLREFVEQFSTSEQSKAVKPRKSKG